MGRDATGGHGDGLVGRRAELATLVSLPDRLEVGEPGLVLVGGEAGIGKTRLARAAVARLTGDARVLVGRCLDLRTARLPYAPLADALRDGPDRLVVEALDALTGQVEVPRARLFELVRSTVVRLAERRRTILVIEDLHWAERETRDALLFLLESARGGHWGLVGTYRPNEARRHPGFRDLLDQLTHRPGVEHLVLDRLSGDEVTELAAGLVGRHPTLEQAQELQRRSDGIPLLVEELVAAEQAGRTGLPSHLRELYLSRLDPLSGTALQLVRLAALTGANATEDLLIAAADVSDDEALDGLEEAVAADCLVATEDHYGFRHELLREAVVDALVPGRARQLHAAIADALADTSSIESAALAHHCYEAGRYRQAAEAALHAADQAQRVHGHDAVHRHLERVLGLWEHLPDDEPVDRAPVLARAAEAAHLSGAHDRAVTLAEEAVARTVDDPVSHAGRLERLARYHWGAGDGVASERAYQRAVEELDDAVPDDVKVQALTGYAWLLEVTGRSDEVGQLVDRAREIADRTRDPLQRCRTLLVEDPFSSDPLGGLEKARELARSLDADEELARAYVALHGATIMTDGGAREALDVAREGARVAGARGMDRLYRRLFTGFAVSHLVALGYWDEAAELLQPFRGLEIPDLPSTWLAMHGAELAARRGDRETVRSLVDQVETLGARIPQQQGPVTVARSARAEDLLWNEDSDAALEEVTNALRDAAHSSVPHSLRTRLVALGAWAAADVAATARRIGRTDELDDLVSTTDELLAWLPDDELLAELDHADRGTVRAQVHTARAQRTRLANAPDPDAWRAAVAAWDELEDPYHAACARCWLGQALLGDRSGRQDARLALDQAWETADRLGAVPLRAAIEQLAARARLSLDAAEPEVGAAEQAARELGLTPREREVLDLVGLGRTNKEIGEILVISHRTVGVHVSNILSKLGASRRTEAVELARRHGLVAD